MGFYIGAPDFCKFRCGFLEAETSSSGHLETLGWKGIACLRFSSLSQFVLCIFCKPSSESLNLHLSKSRPNLHTLGPTAGLIYMSSGPPKLLLYIREALEDPLALALRSFTTCPSWAPCCTSCTRAGWPPSTASSCGLRDSASCRSLDIQVA